MHHQNENREIVEKALDLLGLNHCVTRRSFFKLSGITVVGISALVSLGAKSGKEMPLIIMDQAEGLVISDSTRCVGCRRCELACTEFNDGKAAPTMARIKVSRNLQFGPKGLYTEPRAQGSWGNGLIIQDLCKQCPHPVPCQIACPNDAIEIAPNTNARVINQDKCKGCRICQRACPWGMTTFDEKLEKATKCHLCNGDPQCVKACPSGALQYVPWEDRTKDIAARFVVPAYVQTPANVADTCIQCH